MKVLHRCLPITSEAIFKRVADISVMWAKISVSMTADEAVFNRGLKKYLQYFSIHLICHILCNDENFEKKVVYKVSNDSVNKYIKIIF